MEIEPGMETPDHVAALAVQIVRLPRLALLGVAGPEGQRIAVVRSRAGDILRVTPGDQVDSFDVAAIAEDAVILKRGSRTRRLSMPAPRRQDQEATRPAS